MTYFIIIPLLFIAIAIIVDINRKTNEEIKKTQKLFSDDTIKKTKE